MLADWIQLTKPRILLKRLAFGCFLSSKESPEPSCK